MYNFKNKFSVEKLKVGSKIFCEGQRACLEIEEELNCKGIETKIGCDEAGMWSVFIESVPCSNGD